MSIKIGKKEMVKMVFISGELTVKSLFDQIILGDDESSLLLGIPLQVELVLVGFPPQQKVNSLVMAIVRCVVQWSPLSHISAVNDH